MNFLSTIELHVMPVLAGIGIFALACSDHYMEDPYTPPVEPIEEHPVGLELASANLGPDPHEIGTSWYDYDPRTHVLTPKDQVFQLRHAGEPVGVFEITSYYDERGESGFFTLNTRKAGETAQSVVLPDSVKDAPVCMTQGFSVTSCTSSDALLVWRIASRVLPGAAFTVKEPGVYIHQPYTPGENSTYTLHAFAARSLDEVEDDAEAPELPSSMNPLRSRVGWIHPSAQDLTARQDLHVHATSTRHITQWQVTQLTRRDDELTVNLQLMCQKMASDDQPPFDMDSQEQLAITLDTSLPYQAKLITLCDTLEDTKISGDLVDSSSTPYGALWPQEPFDLFIEHYQGRVSIRPAPGTLLQNWTLAFGEGSTDFIPVDLLEVWEQEP